MLWIKTMGIALIISGFGGWGLMGAGRLQRRVNQLKNLRMAIGFLEKEITCTYTPLTRALKRTAQFCDSPVSHLFSESSDQLQSRTGITAAEAWMSGINKLRSKSDLKESDIEILASAALQLGMSDAREQKKFFTLIEEELKIMEQKASQEAESGNKIWSYGGFIVGAIVVLLLI